MYKIIFYFLIFSLTTSSCKNQHSNLSTQSKNYIDEVIELLKNHSIKKDQINWETFSEKLYKIAKNSKTIENTYPVITFAISELDDSHSYFLPINEKSNSENNKPLPILENEIVPSNIGYIRLPFCIGNEEQTKNYINSITENISIQNKQDTKGWIVDLRDNFGGNMWPMIVAVGPLLKEGVQGYFVYADEKSEPWIYKKGKVFLDSTLLSENKKNLSIINKNTKIAVLTNGKTASSGEAMTVVFKGQPNTKSFGEKTFGVSTGCKSFTLSDGSRINLAISIFADRKGEKYGNSIKPDVICDSNNTLIKSIEWIKENY